MGFEEDTYDTIFKAMQHPIRRRILRMIGEKPSTYTEIQRDLNIDNGLLNYHLEALSSLITKNGEEKYTLSDFGRATAGLIRGVEEPIARRTIIPSSRQALLLKILSISLIVILSFSIWTLYSDNQGLKSDLIDQQSQIQTMLTRSQAYASLLDSNITTPIPKFEAVAKALSREGWNSSSLRDMEVDASLIYARMFSANNGGVSGFEYIGRVYQPVSNYSPRVEYNVTEPGAYPPVVGTVTYRYVWAVGVQSMGTFRSIPPPGSYLVDASTGELFASTMVGVYAVP